MPQNASQDLLATTELLVDVLLPVIH